MATPTSLVSFSIESCAPWSFEIIPGEVVVGTFAYTIYDAATRPIGCGPARSEEEARIFAADAIANLNNQFDLDDEPLGITIDEFIAENEFDADEIAEIRGLHVGEEIKFGGGAAALTVLRRVR